MLLCATGQANESRESGPGQGAPLLPVFAAEDLYCAYMQNEIAADLQAKGKIVVVDGTVSEIARDEDGRAYVELRVAESRLKRVWALGPPPLYRPYEKLEMPPGPLSRIRARTSLVRCYFSGNDEIEAAGLRPRQHVRIQGLCLGKLITGEVVLGELGTLGRKAFVVRLSACRVHTIFPPKAPAARGP